MPPECSAFSRSGKTFLNMSEMCRSSPFNAFSSMRSFTEKLPVAIFFSSSSIVISEKNISQSAFASACS